MKKLLLFLFLVAVFVSCGKREETQTTPPGDQQQMTETQSNQNETQQQSDDQTKPDATSKEGENKDGSVKKDEGKKEDTDKKYVDKNLTDMNKTDTKKDKDDTKKEKEDSELKKIETKKTSSEIDFAPIFAKRCAKCHGKDLKGKKDGGPNLTADSIQNAPDSKLFNIISNGVEADNEDDEDMPSFKKKFSEEEINAAIKFIKSH